MVVLLIYSLFFDAGLFSRFCFVYFRRFVLRAFGSLSLCKAYSCVHGAEHSN